MKTLFSFLSPSAGLQDVISAALVIGILTGWLASLASVRAQSGEAVYLLDRAGRRLSAITDGDQVRLAAELDAPAANDARISFMLSGSGEVIARCDLPSGRARCESVLVDTLGWYWENDGVSTTGRVVEALVDGDPAGRSALIAVAPRPVVMVHGFSSSYQAWQNYLGPQGFLASVGLSGFAVGDGQAPGVMNTGRIEAPTGATNTIAGNAAILGEYIEAVRRQTGAQKVDLLAHSMGGLISRYYIDRVMPARAVGQLIMLGSPMAGTGCSVLPAELGYYLPAVLELRPDYVRGVFNAQITHRRGVPFHALAGTPIDRPVASPCTPVPTDLAVDYASVSAIPLDVVSMPVLHTDLNTSEQVFREYVLPRLQTPAGGFTAGSDLVPNGRVSSTESLQFSQIFSGRLLPGESAELIIPIDPQVTVARFAMYDSSRSLENEVRGASGNVIALDPDTHGLSVVQDPQTLFYLGYGFENPKPGEWRVTLRTTASTPLQGADYALTALFSGGAQLQTATDHFLPALGETVRLTASFDPAGLELAGVPQVEAFIRLPDHSETRLSLSPQGTGFSAEWRPNQSGLHAVKITLSASLADGSELHRAAFTAIDVQPASRPSSVLLVLLAGCLLILLAISIAVAVLWRLNRRRKSAQAAI